MLNILSHIKVFRNLKKCGANIWRSAVFNFRMLPLNEAIHLPIILYGHVNFDECIPYNSGGGIRKMSCKKLKFNSWQIGYPVYHLNGEKLTTKLIIKGSLTIGERGRIYCGVCIVVQPKATLKIDTGFSICSHSRIVCYKDINIEKNVIISWECQIFDTNFHYTLSNDGTIGKKDGFVFIGSNTWLANRVTMLKDSALPQNSVAACSSIVNKDYRESPSGLYAGIPAKLVKGNTRALFSLEGEINDYFIAHPDAKKVHIKEFYKQE